MKITVESKLNEEVIAAFYPLYVAAFDPIRTRAAARHLLTAEEFAAEMIDERIDKYVVWNDNGVAIAMSTLATDLAAVPWISPEYFAARYPEALARGALYYLGYTLVDPGHASQGVFLMMMDALQRCLTENRAVAATDISGYNEARTIGRRFRTLAEADGVNVERVDTQTYYAVTFDGAHSAGISA